MGATGMQCCWSVQWRYCCVIPMKSTMQGPHLTTTAVENPPRCSRDTRRQIGARQTRASTAQLLGQQICPRRPSNDKITRAGSWRAGQPMNCPFSAGTRVRRVVRPHCPAATQQPFCPTNASVPSSRPKSVLCHPTSQCSSSDAQAKAGFREASPSQR